ncbi:PTS sugar transporter subunit IIB [Microbacterium xanthum]|uniref:PTS sugar transporter subunit IIB n=1 Tax=Microbacterium xanthum TaxID=3079794 RepID=UPI002AD344E6|nr:MULTISPECIES: PTS sugar transporter [unclassified Microbacterium]MDZ8171022.1 PTS sugar transporter [Microbacterium sp. KSW-48]MDZ8201539.1 PTS sugar transporter [Microbacterium sp. SSW1-59]
MRILVVCGAGASSTFVVQRLRQAAREQGVDVHATVATTQSLPIDLETADLVLVGPHLHGEIDRIRAEAAHGGSIVVLMPADAYADLDGSRSLALVREAAAGTSHDTTFAHPRIREDHS